ncbi:hypothetical protein DFH09DRAFT_503168 [Mycena vulgaris]|nr:hypothetical protein DFH09DRAFT_503168 [Mycena vulgaris]
MDFPLVAAWNSIESTRSGVIAVYCLTIYEWLEGLPREIELIHSSKWNSIKLSYLICRYYALFAWPLVLFAYVGNHTPQTCAKWMYPVNIVLLPMQFFARGVMLMRAYAFTGRNKSASVFMDFVSLSVIVIDCVQRRSMRGSLGRTFLGQGLFAFAVVFIVHFLSLGTYYNPHAFHNGVGLPYILIISNIMACRLILDLRRKAVPTETELLRQHSLLIENALANNDLWVIEDGN